MSWNINLIVFCVFLSLFLLPVAKGLLFLLKQTETERDSNKPLAQVQEEDSA